MDNEFKNSTKKDQTKLATGIFKRIVTVLVFFIMQALILFLAAGRLDWIWAWVFLGICTVILLINATIMMRINPETIAERGQPKETQGWDKVISGLYGLSLYFLIPLVAGLDARFTWTQTFSVVWNICGSLMLIVGLGLVDWAMFTNAYFSTAVRIQSERGHVVCHSGPYHFVRHPGYVGFILQSLFTPLLLGSWWALLPGLAAAILMIMRTSLEDKMLQDKLPGYKDYVREVSYRLLPGIW